MRTTEVNVIAAFVRPLRSFAANPPAACPRRAQAVAAFLYCAGIAAAATAPRGVNLAALEGWDIVLDDQATITERYAAEQLRDVLREAGGVRLPIVTAARGADHHVFVGPGDGMRTSAVGFSTETFGDEDFRIVVRDGNTAIAGGRPRGTLYGVYSFLEDHLGVRFLTLDHTHVPPIGTWRVVGPLDRFYRPPLSFRWSFYREINAHPPFATRFRINTVGTGCSESVPSDPKLGGKMGLKLVNHSFYSQVSSLEYGREHPEYFCVRGGGRWFSRPGDGRSENRQNQPCLTHPDVKQIVTDAVLSELAAETDYRSVNVGQNDNDRHCQCQSCGALDEREGSPMGSLLSFVNGVADTVSERFPDRLVGTFAYQYSRKPPRSIRPRPNVHIQLCSIECCVIHRLDDPSCSKNAAFLDEMKAWGDIAPNLGIWHYNVNFSDYLLPCPNLRAIDANVRTFAAHGIRAVFMQAAGETVSGELSDLRNYMISKLLWNPALDGARLMDEFLKLHYGRAAPAIRRYIDLIHDTAEASGRHPNCFGGPASFGLADPQLARRAVALFDEALELADDTTVRRRVEKASLGAVRLAIDPLWRRKEGAQLEPERVKWMRPLVDRYVELCTRFEVSAVSSAGRHWHAVRDKVVGD